MGACVFLGIDLGTGSVKALLIDEAGGVIGEASRTYPYDSPTPGWAETHPDAWWRATTEAVRECAGARGANVRGIGLSGQAHGVALCDETGAPLRAAILWPDARSRDEVAAFRDLPTPVREGLANPIVTGMAGVSLLWLKRHEPDALAKARYGLAAKDWLRLRMTGVAATEPSDASMTLLYDMQANRWADEILDRFDIRSDLLPPIVPSADVAGRLQPGPAEALGLRPGTPVAAGLADSAACLLGMGQLQPGRSVLQVGSGIQFMSISETCTAALDPSYNTYRTCTDNYYKMAAMQNGGLAFEWARRALNADWPEMYEAAFSVEAGSNGVLFLPYVTGERTPHMNPAASGGWINLRLGCERAHLIRAVFEGVAFSVRDGWETLKAAGIRTDMVQLTGGGVADRRWQQLLADTIGLPLRITGGGGRAPVGAALLGGIAASHWQTLDGLPFPEAEGGVIEPREVPGLEARYDAFREAYRRLHDGA